MLCTIIEIVLLAWLLEQINKVHFVIWYLLLLYWKADPVSSASAGPCTTELDLGTRTVNFVEGFKVALHKEQDTLPAKTGWDHFMGPLKRAVELPASLCYLV